MVYRGWRFVHPDFDDGGEFVGLPLSAQGGIGMVEGDNAVRQAILLLISTVPGERVMRPDYGCDLYQLLFSERVQRVHYLILTGVLTYGLH